MQHAVKRLTLHLSRLLYHIPDKNMMKQKPPNGSIDVFAYMSLEIMKNKQRNSINYLLLIIFIIQSVCNHNDKSLKF